MKYTFIESPNKTEINKRLIVIHWIVGTAKTAINMFQRRGGVSAHYIIDQIGKVTQMVEEQDIAWHAGVSSYKRYPTDWNGNEWSSLNPCSIGIELEGPPSRVRGMSRWPDKMLSALIELCKDIATRHPGIKLTDHSRISPGRKIDVIAGTGRKEDVFPWEKLVNLTGLREA